MAAGDREVDAAHPGQHDVEDDGLVRCDLDPLQSDFGAFGNVDSVTLLGETGLQDGGEIGFIFNNEHTRGWPHCVWVVQCV